MNSLKRCFEVTPIPIAGLMLGLAGLGNLLKPYESFYRVLAGILAVVIILFLLGRIVLDRNGFFQDLNNPVVASVAPAFSMGVIILASYLINVAPDVARVVWFGGILLHVLLVVLFSKRFIINNFDIRQVFPSYFIVYVGLVVASVTAPVFDQLLLGQIIFWLGFISYMILLPLVSYRIIKIKMIKNPAMPTLAIFTAPAGLCLAGYMSAFPEKNILMITGLTGLTLIMIVAVILYLPKMMLVGFCPSFSAFTFPFVITAIGLKQSAGYFFSEYGSSYLQFPARIVEFLAIILVIVVFALYSRYIIQQ
ncbi:MAG: TDT family transporter [Bacillota bacterium]